MEYIRVERAGPVRTVTLTRGDKRNALNLAMLDEMVAAFNEKPDAEERVLVIRAEGPSFCSGMDLKERLAKPIVNNESPIESMLHALENHPLPAVAVVHGDAIAGGCELALHCDFVVAASTARFGMSLAQIGLAPTWFLAKKLMEVAGPVGAREVLLLGDPLGSEQLYDMGVIHGAAPPDELEAAADKVIDRLSRNAPLSLRAIKALLVREMAFRDHVDHSAVDELVNATRTSEDSKEGIAARLEKRAPVFRGV
jgi:enoyl-CoA hydratase/carnithine racemase